MLWSLTGTDSNTNAAIDFRSPPMFPTQPCGLCCEWHGIDCGIELTNGLGKFSIGTNIGGAHERIGIHSFGKVGQMGKDR